MEMTAAEQIVRTLEAERHVLVLRLEAIRSAGAQLAYAILIEDSFQAKQELSDAEDEYAALEYRIALHDLALIEARRRAEARDAETVMLELKLI
jgi:hypothetical protein